MKRIIQITLTFIIVFAILTFSTAKIETPFDGHDTYGFPFTFHKVFSGMCDPCPPNPSATYYGWLVVDVLFAAIVAVALIIGFNKLKNLYKAGSYPSPNHITN
jgi:hypothetical protein